jgi:hypothetical protein
MRRALVLVAMVGLPLAFASAREEKADTEELVPNPAYVNWSSFKPKMTTVTLKEVVTEHLSDNPNAIDVTARPHHPMVILNTYSLQSVSEKDAVVRWVQTDVHHHHSTEHSPKRIIYPAKAPPGHKGGVLSKEKVSNYMEGEETVMAAGKEIKCKWHSSDIKIGDETSSSKMWWSPDVPGGIVKQVTTKKQGDKVVYEVTTILTVLNAEKK